MRQTRMHTELVRFSNLDPDCRESHPRWSYVVARHADGDHITENEPPLRGEAHEVLMWKKVETGEKRQEGVITQFETIRKEKERGNRVNGTLSLRK